MHIKNAVVVLSLSLTSYTLVGCSLAPNQAEKSAISPVHNEDWLTDKEVDSKLSQGLTASLVLNDAFLSMAARLYLIRKAQHSLDLQYYIWQDDSIGHLMLAELLNAADRGVQVRLLIDDQNGTQLDLTLQQLTQHPNIQIKLFNPYKYRNLRAIDYVLRPLQINRRMHNKLIIADGAIGVTGGRNISREYFDASEHFQFTDMDILFYGQAIYRANTVFYEFWNDDLSYSTQQLLPQGTAQGLNTLRQKYSLNAQQKDQLNLRIQHAQSSLIEQFKAQKIHWAKAHFIADSPDKARAKAKDQTLIYRQMRTIMGEPKQHLELVSAYFVPTQTGTNYLSQLAQNKVKTRVLTNSFLANDVALVHAFYQKYRVELLKSGVQLYEFKPYIERSRRTWYEVATGNVIPAKGKNSSSLHAKFFDSDGMVFIGSFNFDPRSAHLNTEVGLVVESEPLQSEISGLLDQYLPQVAYELKLNAQGKIIWLDHQKNGQIKRYNVDPETTKFQRFMIHIVSYLPIEWMM